MDLFDSEDNPPNIVDDFDDANDRVEDRDQLFGHVDDVAPDDRDLLAEDEPDQQPPPVKEQRRADPLAVEENIPLEKEWPDYPRISFRRANPNSCPARESLLELLMLPPSSFGLFNEFPALSAPFQLPHRDFAPVMTRADYRRQRLPVLFSEMLYGVKANFQEAPMWSRRVRYCGLVKQLQEPKTVPPLWRIECSFAIASKELSSIQETRSNSLVFLHMRTDKPGNSNPLRVDIKSGHELDAKCLLGYVTAISADNTTRVRGHAEPQWPGADGTLPSIGAPPLIRAIVSISFVRNPNANQVLSAFEAELKAAGRVDSGGNSSITLELTCLGKLYTFWRAARMLSLPERPAEMPFDEDYNASPLLDMIINPNRPWACPPPPANRPIDTPLDLLNYVLEMDLPSVSAIIGGPGTGKTSGIVNMIMQRLEGVVPNNDKEHRLRFAVFCPSNAAANAVYEKFQAANQVARAAGRRQLIVRRLGERRKFTDAIRQDMDRAQQEYQHEGARLGWNNRTIERRFITQADVFVTTAGSAQSPLFSDHRRMLRSAVAIFDEAGQGHETEILLPLFKTKLRHLVLVGDGAQLGPTIFTPTLRSHPLPDVSAFARLVSRRPDSLNQRFVLTLNPQMRMRPRVARLVSRLSYPEDALRRPPWPVLRAHLNARLQNIPPIIAFSGESWREVRERISPSLGNPNEAAFALLLLRSALRQCRFNFNTGTFAGQDAQHPPLRIGLISLYRSQVKALERAVVSLPVPAGIVTVGTVDSMQGHAFDLVIVSAVRASIEHGIGFAAVLNRLNVAISRGASIFVLAHYGTFSLEPGWSTLFHMTANWDALNLDADSFNEDRLVAYLEQKRHQAPDEQDA